MATHEALVQKLLAQSPPAELPDVVNSLKLLTSNASLVDSAAAAAARQVAHAHMVALDMPGGAGKVLLTACGALADGNSYLEPCSGRVVTVDHVAGAVTGTRPADASELAPPDVEPFRVALQGALQSYCSDIYAPHGTLAVYGREGSAAAGSMDVTVCLSSAKANLRNFWSGRLGSCWQACFTPGTGDITLSGLMEVDVHYCEDGNVQLRAKHNASTSTQAHDAVSFGSAVAGAIQRAEAQYYAALEASFDTMAHSTFKRHLRRALPVTRSRFAWEQQAHKLAGELASKEKAAAAAR